VLNHLSKAALQKHIEASGRRARSIMETNMEKACGRSFATAWKCKPQCILERRFSGGISKVAGYDLTPYLPLFNIPALVIPIQLSLTAAVRWPRKSARAFGMITGKRADVMTENFYQPLMTGPRRTVFAPASRRTVLPPIT